MAKVYPLHIELGESAHRKLRAESKRRGEKEGRKRYPIWRIIDDLVQTLPEPDDNQGAALCAAASITED